LNKIIFVLIVALTFGSSTLFSQNLGTQRKTNQFTEYLDRHNENDIYDINDPSTYNGSPFAKPLYLLGNVYREEELISNRIALRYNVYSEEIEVKESILEDNNKAKALIKSTDIHVSIANDLFVYLPLNESLPIGGYYQVLHKGDFIKLYKKLLKKFYLPKKAATSLTKDVPATFIDREVFYIALKNDRYYELPSTKNKIIKAFKKNGAIVKNYIKEKDLDISNEKDLIRLIIYIDSLELSEL
jgi:hypothetical protein